MKTRIAILLSAAFLTSLLCGCSTTADSTSSVSSQGASNTSETVSTPIPTEEPASSTTQSVSLLFQKVTGVSREWQNGKYIVNGIDDNGNKICGITDDEGNAFLVDGYTALYPLADGRLLATTEEDASGECSYAGRSFQISSIGFVGIILDENFDIIYQPDESLGYERLYPINSHLILSIRAKTGFEGVTANACVLNTDGQLLYNCSDIINHLTDWMQFDDEGKTWTFIPSEDPSLQLLTFGPNDNLGENHLMQLQIRSRYSPFDMFIYYIDFNDDTCVGRQLSAPSSSGFSAWEKFEPYNSTTFIRGGRFTNYLTSTALSSSFETIPSDMLDLTSVNDILNDMDNETSIYSHFGYKATDSNGIGYFAKTSYESDNTPNSPTYTFFSIDGYQIDIPQDYMDRYNGSYILNDKFLLLLKGSDGNNYGSFFNLSSDSSSTSPSDPFLMPKSPEHAVLSGSVLATSNMGFIYLYNTETGEVLDSLEFTDFKVTDLFSSNNCIIVAGTDTSNSTIYHIYSLASSSLLL